MSSHAVPNTTTGADLHDAHTVLRALAEVWAAAPVDWPAGVPSIAAAEARLVGGVAALTGETIVDERTLVANARRIAERLHAVPGYADATLIVDWLSSVASALEDEGLAMAVAAGAWETVAEIAHRLGFDTIANVRGASADERGRYPDVFALSALLDYAARPALRAAAVVVRPIVAAARWTRGSCPACGASPLLSVTCGKEGERTLYCGRCGTGWPFPRVRCVACGERDHRRLGMLHAAGESEFRRVEICDHCRGYLKSIAALDAPDSDALLRLDLETAGLDFVALEQGYHRASLR